MKLYISMGVLKTCTVGPKWLNCYKYLQDQRIMQIHLQIFHFNKHHKPCLLFQNFSKYEEKSNYQTVDISYLDSVLHIELQIEGYPSNIPYWASIGEWAIMVWYQCVLEVFMWRHICITFTKQLCYWYTSYSYVEVGKLHKTSKVVKSSIILG